MAELIYSKMLALPTGIASRRSHLDSVTYRTLVQLLSLDLDGGQNPKSEVQNSEFAKKSDSDDAISKGGLFQDSSLLLLKELEELDIDNDGIDTELLDMKVADYAKLIDSTVKTSGQFGLGNNCYNNVEATNQEKVTELERLKTVRVQSGSLEYKEDAGRRAGKEPVIDSDELCNEGIGEGEQQETTTFSDPFAECCGMKKLRKAKSDEIFEEDKASGEGLKDLSTVEAQNGNTEFVEVSDKEKELRQGIYFDQLKHDNEPSENIREIEGKMQHGSYVYSDPFVKYSETKSLTDNKGGKDFEEGEISGEDVELADEDSELADEYVEVVHENSKFEDEIKSNNENRSTYPPKSTFSDMNVVDMHSRRVENCKPVHVNREGVTYAINLNSKENEVNLSASKEANGQVKKKHGPLTEGRKAKRKIAKKRKRAKKEREQGVKRLKLQPVVKPKEIKYCNFYLAGRCQQGDTCKFSHDTTPLTKSQPCKFFACGTCMKGDDCPFDHQLSKYPCHKHMSNGMCPRGDSCMFSHKLSVTEGTSPASVVSKKDPLASSGKSNAMKHLPMNINQSQSSPQSIARKPIPINAPKIPTHIPNGVQFLSFSEKCNQQKQEKPVLLSQNEKMNMLQRMLVRSTANNSEANKKSNGEKSFDKAASTTASKVVGNSKAITTEITEASKILEEFLFCGPG